KPRVRMLAAINGPAASVAPSISTWPCSEVTSSAVRPQVPTYQVLPNTRRGGARSFQPSITVALAGHAGTLSATAIAGTAAAAKLVDAVALAGLVGWHAASSIATAQTANPVHGSNLKVCSSEWTSAKGCSRCVPVTHDAAPRPGLSCALGSSP